ncbi:MAG TPA: hypothetical protein PLK24_09300 [Atribacter sp.]|uniref:hypothetical protein n=1 Tax=Atribacter sp. TaxID=2847780 RepID=UPI002CA7C799|nr:hypothetical protein [Atribacter sp.]HQK84120.1 hypothetical protein [Atribacter sp.]
MSKNNQDKGNKPINEGYQPLKKGYQPTAGNLDPKNPPRGGSGVPSKPSNDASNEKKK